MIPTARPADTTPEVWAMLQGRWRSMSPEQRAVETFALIDDLTALSIAGIRAADPSLSESEVNAELARRRCGRALVDAAARSRAS